MGRETAVWLTSLCWLAAVAAGFGLWERYDTTPGTVRPDVPVADEAAPGGWRLTVFAHPRCPCSGATIRELAEIAASAPELSVRVLFVNPTGASADWERSANWDAASRIAGAKVARDAGGTEARRFGAETSGQAVLTDPTGHVVFRGGLTRARGRAGESAGRRAVLNWIRYGSGATEAPVFGCPVFTPEN